ncbi:MAG: transposase [Armatimonadetes bacterium]|nr:transposase [Armatimonadota bacterium]
MTRKQYSPEMKMQIVKETLETGNASIVARRHDIAPSLVARWARCYKRYGTFYPQRRYQEQTAPVFLLITRR